MLYKSTENYLFRLPEGDDLIEGLVNFAKQKEILTGVIFAIGAVKDVVLAYYDFEEKRYKEIELDGTYELVSAIGNISVKEDNIFVHLHTTVANSQGKIYGGHLMKAKVVVAEVLIEKMIGNPLYRKLQPNGLYLWDI
ncbi:MAG: DNA-binding protein [Candidatus Woesearchaeota archaeon]